MTLNITPGDWLVEPNLDLPGHYVLDVAGVEQEQALASEDEADMERANARDWNNAKLMQAAPALFEIVSLLADRSYGHATSDDPLIADALEIVKRLEAAQTQ